MAVAGSQRRTPTSSSSVSASRLSLNLSQLAGDAADGGTLSARPHVDGPADIRGSQTDRVTVSFTAQPPAARRSLMAVSGSSFRAGGSTGRKDLAPRDLRGTSSGTSFRAVNPTRASSSFRFGPGVTATFKAIADGTAAETPAAAIAAAAAVAARPISGVPRVRRGSSLAGFNAFLAANAASAAHAASAPPTAVPRLAEATTRAKTASGLTPRPPAGPPPVGKGSAVLRSKTEPVDRGDKERVLAASGSAGGRTGAASLARKGAHLRADRVPLPSGGRFYSKPEVLRLRSEFDACDDDGSGEVSVKELAAFMHRQRRQKEAEEEARVKAAGGRPGADRGGSDGLDFAAGPRNAGGGSRSEAEKLAAGDAWASQLLAFIDKDGSGEVGFSEFLLLHFPDSTKKERDGIAAWVDKELAERKQRLVVPEITEQLTEDQLDDITGMFEVYDRDGDGSISKEELAEALVSAGMLDSSSSRAGALTFKSAGKNGSNPAERSAALKLAMGTVDEMFNKHARGKKELDFDAFSRLMAESYLH